MIYYLNPLLGHINKGISKSILNALISSIENLDILTFF